jgi:Fic family protein
MGSRSGIYKINLSGELAYRSFTPSPLPPNPSIVIDDNITDVLIKANRQLALLDVIVSRIPNVKLFISMYVRKEALMSSKIEGTQATLEDVLDPSVDTNANLDVAEVINYIRATEYAIGRLRTLPLSNRLIKEIHAVLMEGTRGQEKSPGEFRHSQNWIGGQGSTLKSARYIPPMPSDMVEAMSDLEKYINSDDGSDVLVQAALIHYQFETIHPFLDGNGRVGRLLITLFLINRAVLSTPALYISYFLKKNRIEYYDRLSEVRRTGDYEQWVKFFLEAVYESAKDATTTIDKLTTLHEQSIKAISVPHKSISTTMRLFAYIEENPIVEIGRTAEALDMAFNTASSAIKRLCDMGILVQNSGGIRRKAYSYDAYLDILRDGT